MVIVACDNCRYGLQTREKEFICYNSTIYPKGKLIYSETFNVLKKVGCRSASPTKEQMERIIKNLNELDTKLSKEK